ncbi:hypothetical protein [Paenibacillus riograndensis]|uniref:hypothetical protein n=1 Tax=Paenibacillus riograndensis TaxID=483937 RepID=UPI0007649D12
MGEVYRLAELKDAERLLDITYRAYETIRELGLHWPAATADLALIKDNIAKNECYEWRRDYVFDAKKAYRSTNYYSKGLKR